jgi:hypothetical protein
MTPLEPLTDAQLDEFTEDYVHYHPEATPQDCTRALLATQAQAQLASALPADLATIHHEYQRLLPENFPDQGYDWRTPVMALMAQFPPLLAELTQLRTAAQTSGEAKTTAPSEAANTITHDQLEAAQHLMDTATSGPWNVLYRQISDTISVPYLIEGPEMVEVMNTEGISDSHRSRYGHEIGVFGMTAADAEFIAGARVLLPALLAEVNRLRQR